MSHISACITGVPDSVSIWNIKQNVLNRNDGSKYSLFDTDMFHLKLTFYLQIEAACFSDS
jgi:hypothetical protein